MRTRLIPSLLVSAAAACCALPSPAWAQEDTPQDAPQDAPQAGATDAARADRLLMQLDRLYPRALEAPAPVNTALVGDPKMLAKERGRYQREMKVWLSLLDRIPELSLDYREAAGEAAIPKAWYYAGFARVRRAEKTGAEHGRELLSSGTEELRTYLDRAPRDAAFRTDAGRLLAHAELRLAGGDADAIAAVAPHADVAVRALLAAGRADEAGALAYTMMKSLIFAEREAQAAALATGWDAGAADFGRSTDGVRALVRRARIRVGERLPALPDVASYTAAPMPWDAVKGKPYVLHFFSTTVSSTVREVETILVPLRDRFRAKGLRLLGCSMDRAMSDEEIERTRANWKEWGKQETLHDGRLVSVREWAELRGVDWPWYWDGKWTRNVLVRELGIEVNAPFAILVDGGGVIRWRGQPFEGLAEAVAALLE